MNKGLIKFFGILMLACFVLCSCNPDLSSNGSGSGGNSSGGTGYTANTSDRNIKADSYDAMPEISTTVEINLTDMTVDGTKITSEKNSSSTTGITFKSEDSLIKINAEKYSGSVTFNVTGTISGYGLQIKRADNTTDVTKVVLNGAIITSTSTPCLLLKTTRPSYVVIEGNSTLTDGRSYGTSYSSTGDDSKGTLYSQGPIILSGTATLTIDEKYKHGIASKDYIKVNSGTYVIKSTGRNGIQAINGFIMNNGKITINGTGNNTNNQSRGIVVEGEESTTYKGEGFVVINDGTLDITTVSKGITAKWDVDDDAETTTDTTDDPYPYVEINGGTITITTTGTPNTNGKYGYVTDADGESTYEEIKLSPEGIEGKQAVFIKGGTITLNTTDDCINSSSSSASIEISGGNIYACSSNNDAIDSNGTLTISGGNVVAIATSNAECAFDCDNNTFSITGGNIAGIGSTNITTPSTSACTQGVLVLSSSYLGSAGRTIAVKNSSGSVVYAFTIPSSRESLSGCVGIFSNLNLTSSGKYTLVYGATAVGGENFNGLYTTLPTINVGTSQSSSISFSSSYVYNNTSGGQRR